MLEQKLTYAGQLKAGQILLIKYQLGSKIIEEVKFVKKVYPNDVQFNGMIWRNISQLLKQDVTVIGQRKKLLHIFPYNSYYSRVYEK